MKTANLSAVAILFVVPVAVFAQTGDNTADHAAMMAKLQITSPLRPGPAGRLNADGSAPPNFANYDESKATARSPAPPLLAMSDGRRSPRRPCGSSAARSCSRFSIARSTAACLKPRRPSR